MIAILGMLLDEKVSQENGLIKQLFEYMLKNYIFMGNQKEEDIEGFINKFITRDKDEKISDHLNFFLDRVVKLVKNIERELEYLKKFWTSA